MAEVRESPMHLFPVILCFSLFILHSSFFILSPPFLLADSVPWTSTVSERTVTNYPELRESVWTLTRPPADRYDVIALHRIVKASTSENPHRPVLVFLPAAHMHGEVVIPDERYDLRLYCANRGIETWTLDYRTHTLPREQILDSRFMQSWTVETFVEDTAVAADFVRTTSGQQHLFVGGFGRGATFATLMAARYGRDNVRGLILLDGYTLDPPDEETLYRERPETPNWFADDLERRYLPYARWIQQLKDTISDPNGPDFLPVHVFNNRTEAMAHFLYVSPMFGQQGGLSNAKEGYADPLILARLFLQEDRYWPRVQNHGGFDFKRHLAGTQFDYESAVTALHLPIFAVASGNMNKAGIPWIERVEYSARATASKDVHFQVLDNWGHLDVLFGSKSAQGVFQPLTDWILQRATPQTSNSAEVPSSENRRSATGEQ
ncbi:MAG: alpha/beta hydrolase [Candidatus Binatia bacterium]